MTAPLAESLFMISVMLLLVSFSFAPPYPCRFSHVKIDTLDTKNNSLYTELPLVTSLVHHRFDAVSTISTGS